MLFTYAVYMFVNELFFNCLLVVVKGFTIQIDFIEVIFLYSFLKLGFYFYFQLLKHTMRLFVKKNLSNQTLIDERFLI